jgi:adenosylcobinamide-phosphate synthase
VVLTSYPESAWSVVIAAVILDLAFGDPRWLPHPVQCMGWFIRRIESILRYFAQTPKTERFAGVVLAAVIVALVYFSSRCLLLVTIRMSSSAGFLFAAFLASTAIAARGLGDAAHAVLRPLDAGSLEQARAELSLIVGRDTAGLDEQGITRAAIETVAENTSDGVVAPLLFLAIGGPALALAYKAVNTLDSMVGYKNERYLNFGWAAARLDDAANYIPARITAVLICLCANVRSILKFAIRNLKSEMIRPWRIMLRDGRNHPSPNSGYPEAAMAGSLGIRLGGPSAYAGVLSDKPFIGEASASLDKKDIEKAVRFMYCTTLFAALPAALLGRQCINRFFP